MEKKTIGKFISALRKANGMTQKELGEKLFVSDKTVSRWECDECTPELSLIPAIAEIFGVTTDELLRGERNNPERASGDSEEVLNRQKAKSDKQVNLMLNNRTKKFANLSCISIGLILAGMIASFICETYSKYELGFGFASIFVIASIICQICFTISFRVLGDEEDSEFTERVRNTNTHMVFTTVKIIFAAAVALAFCLPVVLTGRLALAAIALLVMFFLYKIFILKMLVRKEIVWLEEQKVRQIYTSSKLLGKICVVFLIVAAVIMAVAFIIYEFVIPYVETEMFYDPDQFIGYVQSEYDAWYVEKYGVLPPSQEEGMQTYYPNAAWDEIDGKEFYYRADLYESIHVMTPEEGRGWEIEVTTYKAVQEAKNDGFIFVVCFLSAHGINIIACLIWYFVERRKLKTV